MKPLTTLGCLFLALVAIAGSGEPQNAADAQAGLRLKLDGVKLLVELTNKGKKPISVDRDLVFGLDLYGVDAGNEGVFPKIGKPLPAPAAGDWSHRFQPLVPHETIRRTISLDGPFKLFIFGHSYPQHAITAYESVGTLDFKKAAKIKVRYAFVGESVIALKWYAGKALDIEKLYDGDSKAEVKVP